LKPHDLRCRFIKKCLGAPSDTDVEQLKADNEELKRQKQELEKKIEALQKEVSTKTTLPFPSWRMKEPSNSDRASADPYILTNLKQLLIKFSKLVNHFKIVAHPLTLAPYPENRGTKTKVIVERSLIRMWMEGPAVSLQGSPTVSPVTAAL